MIQRLSKLVAAAILVASCAFISGCAGKVDTGGYELSSMQRRAMEDAVAKVKPALVRIYIVEPSYYEGREQKFRASGSGAIVSPDGYVVTNHHVAGKAIRIVCTMPNREEVPAELIGTDPATDIAVIKLKPADGRQFPYATFGDSDEVRVGDTVLALGSPRGLSQSVTLGIVSNTEMIMPGRGFGLQLDGENVGELVRWFAHDAEIHPGNSGGPLVNMNGEIIGVNEISFGLAGAIPGNIAKKVAEQIIANKEVNRAYVGLIFQPILKSSPIQTGILVAGSLKDSPAEKAGIKPGDILLQIGDTPLEARFYEDIPIINNYVADLAIDKPVAVKVFRDGKETELIMTPVKRQPAMTKTDEFRDWGMTARDLSLFTQLSMARDKKAGVYVTSTRPGGPVAQAKPEIRRGDIITSINKEPVANSEELRKKTQAILGSNSEKRVDTLVGYERDEQSYLTVVKLGIEELDDPGVEVKKSWLPIETQVLTRDLATHMSIPDVKGVRVTRVYPEKPADFALQPGDIITAIDDEPVEAAHTQDAEVFRTMIRQYKIGSKPELTILRDGKEQKVVVELMVTPKYSREMERYRDIDFDFILREATYYDKQDPKLEGADVEVIADSVTEGGWAALADLRVGDVILNINGQDITTVAEAEAAMKQVKEEKPAYVVFQVRRGIQNLFLEMEPLWKKD